MNAVIKKLHNPRARACGCDADCWCNRTALGRAVKWWFPARFFGIQHKNHALEEWQDSHPAGDPRRWKQAQDERRASDSGNGD
jgi:hypothetical protein